MSKTIITIIVIIIVAGLGYWFYQSISSPEEEAVVSEGSKDCVNDDDCVVFGEDGDCNCGCFNRNYQWKKEGDCFCAAPKSCKCIEGLCEGVFEEEVTAEEKGIPGEQEEEEKLPEEKVAEEEEQPEAKEGEKLPSVWTIEGVVIPGGYCDAEVVKLPDGKYRMYYGLDPRTYPENINIVSAVSSDGLNWTPEPGTRLPEGHMYAMPSVIELPDGRWRMYYNSGGIQSAISDDGINFQQEGLRLATNLGGPSVIRLDDGRYRMYLQGCDEPPPPAPPTCGIKSAISSDGLRWEIESGIRIDSTKPPFYVAFFSTPDIVKLSDGSFQLYFQAGSGEMDEWGRCSNRGIYSADSVDGLSFSNITFLFTGKYIDEEGREMGMGDPCVVKIEGGWRIYFASDSGPFSTGISSAVIANLLP